MFLWMELTGVENTHTLLEAFKEAKVVVAPGSFFGAHSDPAKPASSGVRVSFANASDETIYEGFRRLGELLEKRKAAAGV